MQSRCPTPGTPAKKYNEVGKWKLSCQRVLLTSQTGSKKMSAEDAGVRGTTTTTTPLSRIHALLCKRHALPHKCRHVTIRTTVSHIIRHTTGRPIPIPIAGNRETQ